MFKISPKHTCEPVASKMLEKFPGELAKKTGEFFRSSICKKMWVNNAKITYHVQRDVHLHFLSPLIKKSNSSICIVYLSFFWYPETKHKSYLL